MSRAAIGVGAAAFLPNCATTGGGGGSSSLPPATKENPFINSLGMKFVPVPRTKILMCTTETTAAQYKAAGLGYEVPAFAHTDDHPAVNVSWNDATAWCAWLSEREGRRYRLPTDAEWCAAAGSSHPWGSSWPPPNNVGNFAGQEMRGATAAERALLFKGTSVIGGFSDRHKFTAPVGSYPQNHLGIHDLDGNVQEWCEDWHADYPGKCRVLRGGAWIGTRREVLATSPSNFNMPDMRFHVYGFRCVMA